MVGADDRGEPPLDDNSAAVCVWRAHTCLAWWTCRVTQRPTVSVQSAESHRLKELEQIRSHPALELGSTLTATQHCLSSEQT